MGEGNVMEKHLLVDGRNLLYMAYYGMPALSTANNHQSGALYGFLQILRKLIVLENPDFVLVCWDGEPIHRRRLFPEYKRNRDHTKINFNEFNRQLDAVMDFLRALAIPQALHSELEADDIIAAYVFATTFQYPKECHTLIASADKDFWQLVSKSTSCLNPRTDSWITYKNFKDKTGFKLVSDYLQYRILVGDSSDNIPGLIAGVGDKRARIVIENQHVEDLLVTHDITDDSIKRQCKLIDLAKMLPDIKHKILSIAEGIFVMDVMRDKVFTELCLRWEFQSINRDWLLPFKTLYAKAKERSCFRSTNGAQPKRAFSLFKRTLNQVVRSYEK